MFFCSSITQAKDICTKIQEGILLKSDGSLIETGYDEWGYNYQARIFNGLYCDAFQDESWCQPWKDDELVMKWNDAWLSNKDCDGDGQLDRHYGFDSYIGSGAWLTNHQKGFYIDGGTGETCKWSYFVKIVAAPVDAVLFDDTWYTDTGEEIGLVIWDQFIIIEEIDNDSCAGFHGQRYVSPHNAGFGY
jgi:hypothetical protein